MTFLHPHAVNQMVFLKDMTIQGLIKPSLAFININGPSQLYNLYTQKKRVYYIYGIKNFIPRIIDIFRDIYWSHWSTSWNKFIAKFMT